MLANLTRLGFLMVFVTTSLAGAQIPDPNHDAPDTAITKANQIELVIPAVDGKIVWKDVAAALADALSLDVPTAEKMLPRGSLNVRSEFVALAVLGINAAAGDKIAIDLVRDDQGERALRVRCDRSLLAGKPDRAARPATMDVDQDWRERSADRPIVLCIHGFHSTPEVFQEMRRYLRESGYATGALGYDDEQAVAQSAAQVSRLAQQWFAERGQKPELVLVGHSMGGLIAREWTENPELSGDTIVGMITIATPHRGSHWATMPPLLDLVSKGDFNRQDVVDVILHQPSSQSLVDLAPGSEQLRRMQSRPRREGVQYTTVVGTGSPVSPAQADRIGNILRTLDGRVKVFRLIRPRIDPLVAGFDEIVRGKGDGAVSADHATIEGVNDVVTFDLAHGELVRPLLGQTRQPVWELIVQRLETIRRGR